MVFAQLRKGVTELQRRTLDGCHRFNAEMERADRTATRYRYCSATHLSATSKSRRVTTPDLRVYTLRNAAHSHRNVRAQRGVRGHKRSVCAVDLMKCLKCHFEFSHICIIFVKQYLILPGVNTASCRGYLHGILVDLVGLVHIRIVQFMSWMSHIIVL